MLLPSSTLLLALLAIVTATQSTARGHVRSDGVLLEAKSPGIEITLVTPTKTSISPSPKLKSSTPSRVSTTSRSSTTSKISMASTTSRSDTTSTASETKGRNQHPTQSTISTGRHCPYPYPGETCARQTTTVGNDGELSNGPHCPYPYPGETCTGD
ncbi:hypothetical protein BDY21DRAFT_346138 [Lineolata rhizophorae]|uniref:Uncharacterized protein n=1 Tax=Lineolata rhizophorae TaxID=578093 RepID=A0A6A6NYJ5_9PEZI|nr:hypothetical protein BDY21DRAFT_346138 [Lineolata rhizophorae]